ncbi:hypothetical protein BJ742DRAFT_241003 [Cladochytrium replicatum]|nr:hypothetical protein BJ742DRAFT_241003 [Cladochytrium replicatum]
MSGSSSQRHPPRTVQLAQRPGSVASTKGRSGYHEPARIDDDNDSIRSASSFRNRRRSFANTVYSSDGDNDDGDRSVLSARGGVSSPRLVPQGMRDLSISSEHYHSQEAGVELDLNQIAQSRGGKKSQGRRIDDYSQSQGGVEEDEDVSAVRRSISYKHSDSREERGGRSGGRNRRKKDDDGRSAKRELRKEGGGRGGKDSTILKNSPMFSHTPVILGRNATAAQEDVGMSENDDSKSPETKQPGASRVGTAKLTIDQKAKDMGPKITETILKKLRAGKEGAGTVSQPNANRNVFKMIDENMRFQTEQIAKQLSDQPGCYIVGVIGRRGAGKSTILSALAKTPQIFAKESTEHQSTHETTGIDLHITPERIVLLDTQPIFSRSVYDRAKRSGDIGYSGDILPKYQQRSHEWIELQSMQIATFLYYVCHVLVVVMDNPNDTEMWDFLKKVEGLKRTVSGASRLAPNGGPANATSPNAPQEFFPEVIFVVNKAEPSIFSPAAVSDLSESIAQAFQDSHLRILHGTVTMANSFAMYRTMTNLTSKRPSQLPPNLFLLPRSNPEQKRLDEMINSKSTDWITEVLDSMMEHPWLPATYPFMMKQLRNQIFEVPRSAVSPAAIAQQYRPDGPQTASGAAMAAATAALAAEAAATGAPWMSHRRYFQISEKDWFRSAWKIWDGIRRADLLQFAAALEVESASG